MALRDGPLLPATEDELPKLSHYTTRGEVSMVDVSAKAVTTRTAVAHAFVRMSPKVLRAVRRLKQ